VPDGLAFDPTSNLLYVCDAGFYRVLVFDTSSLATGMKASFVIGQADFVSHAYADTRNGMVGPNGIGVDPAGHQLYVVDGNRVLVYDTTALANGMNASWVIGQSNFTGAISAANFQGFDGGYNATQGVAVDASLGRVFVGDGGNQRVLGFTTPIATNDPNAVIVLGKPDFTTTSTSTAPANTLSFFGPAGLAYDGSRYLYVTDQADNRVLVYDTWFFATNANASYVLGQANFTAWSNFPITNSSLNNPSAVVVDGASHTLFVADWSNDRVLQFDVTTLSNGASAQDGLGHVDVVSGKMDFTGSAPNDFPNLSTFQDPVDVALDPVLHRLYVTDVDRILVFDLSATNDLSGVGGHEAAAVLEPLHTPRGLALDVARSRLYVTDAGYNRVLVFDTAGLATGASPSVVLGQSNFTGQSSGLAQNAFYAPVDVAFDPSSDRLYVTDVGNDRVLAFDTGALAVGMNASFVLGQPNFTSNATATSQSGMNGPRHVAVDGPHQRLYVMDTKNVRALVFDTSALSNGMNASFVLGQPTFTSTTAATTRSGFGAQPLAPLPLYPQGLAVDPTAERLFVADAANSRILVFDTSALANGMNAESYIGQSSWTSATAAAGATGLDAPCSLAYDPATAHLFVADELNHRVLLYSFP
jgi:DNA-binding beta-propeller fold protein YncE